jgi:Asp-tRNA(Asn)/Glu-tRNA(Gln) amidotransferase A subunit family amidase
VIRDYAALEAAIGQHPAKAGSIADLMQVLDSRVGHITPLGPQADEPPARLSDPPENPGPALEDVRRHLENAEVAPNRGAYVWIGAAEAERAAAAVDATEEALPLRGWPLAVKDIFAVQGRMMGAGSAVRAGSPASESDAPIVAGLRRMGAIVVGGTVLNEFAFGATGINEVTGWARNPRDASHIPGGSSSGSAVAVAEGSARIALGTDTGGSVRIPAALCGVVGYKPAVDTITTLGVFPLSKTLDHVGFLANSVADIRRVHEAVVGALVGGRQLRRIGLVHDEVDGSDPQVANRMEPTIRALSRSGVEVVPVSLPSAEDAHAVSTTIMFSEAASVHEAGIIASPELYQEATLGRLLQGAAIPATTYLRAIHHRDAMRASVGLLLQDVDALFSITVPIQAPDIASAGLPTTPAKLVAHTRLGNVTGFPALSMPFPASGLPVGLHLVARDNATLLEVAAAVELAHLDLG